MFASTWVCARCLRRLPKLRSIPSNRRWQTTESITDSISPALLARARSIANEHAILTEKLATEFDSKAAKRLGELQYTARALESYEKAHASLRELHSLLSSPDKELKELAEGDVEPTRELIEQASNVLKSSLIPVHPFAHLPCLIEIRPGAGGNEASIFAADVLRMYESFCARNGMKTTLLKLDVGDFTTVQSGSGGVVCLQEAVLEVDSPGAYGMLRCEAGVHRVQRVPATESKGRTHTSTASVIVLPAIASEQSGDMGENSFNDPKSDYYVDPTEVRVDVMRARGSGGQHVNQTDSAVRLTHVPSGMAVSIQDTRSQIKNREKAWRLLRARIAQQRREERDEEEARMRRGAGAGKAGRENKVRTYNYGQQRVSDHRSGIESRSLDEIMDGGEALEGVIESVRVWMAEQDVLNLVADEKIS